MKSRVCTNVATALDAVDLSAAELARRLGRNEKTVRRWRDGDVMPTTDNLAEIANELDRDLTWFYLPHDPEEAAA